MVGFTATPEWERFRGASQASSLDWAKAQEGGMDAISRAPANHTPTSLNIHLHCRNFNRVIIESYSLQIGEAPNDVGRQKSLASFKSENGEQKKQTAIWVSKFVKSLWRFA